MLSAPLATPAEKSKDATIRIGLRDLVSPVCGIFFFYNY